MKNINNIGNNECTSCGMCAVSCPQKCISMKLNKFGFYSPIIDESECIECGACTDVCYKFLSLDNNNSSAFEGKRIVAAIDKDKKELSTVSSGGVGNRLAIHFFEKGYNVCGVVFDPLKDVCEHIIALNRKNLERFKTSKYIQSYTFNAFSNFDKSKKHVVFGTPCQIFGLRKYLQGEEMEDKFILVDFFCRGTPSLLLWKAYKSFIQRKFRLGDFKRVNFRNKSLGWHKFSMQIFDKNGKEYSEIVYDDLFWSFYLKNTCFNEACYDCALRHDAVYSDIRLGDFWGEKYYNHDEGVSLVILCTKRGEKTWEDIRQYFYEEECLTQDILKSQRFNKYPKYEKYNEVMNFLVNGEKLEDIHSELGLNKQGFYKGKK